MADNSFSLLNVDGFGDIVVKFLDMLEKACVWAVSPHGSKKDFNEGLEAYKKAISENDKLDPFVKGVMIASASKDFKEYINKGKIINYAIDHLKESATFNTDVDWLDYFFEYAKNISNDTVQRIWGRILAEKVNEGNDTSVQRQLIHVLSLMDASTASAFTNLCRITIKYPNQDVYTSQETRFESPYIPLALSFLYRSLGLSYPKESQEYKRSLEYYECIPSNEQMSILEEIGLIQYPEDPQKSYSYPYRFGLIHHSISQVDDSTHKLVKTEMKDYIIEYCGSKYKLLPKEFNPQDLKNAQLPETINVGFVKFTTIGEKLYQLIEVETLDYFEDFFVDYFDKLGFSVEAYTE